MSSRKRKNWPCCFLMTIALACLALQPVRARSPQLKRNRTQTFVVALSDDLKHKAGRISQILRMVMRETSNIQMLDLTDKLQAEAPKKIQKFQSQARELMNSAKQAMREMEYQLVVRHATAARAAFEKMGGHIEPLKRYKESILLIGVANTMLGNKMLAKKAFLDLLLLDPHLKLPKTAYEEFVLNVFSEVKASLGTQPLGSLAIKTAPGSGNLYIDGKLKGVTPDSVDGLIAGRHLVVVKKPGFLNWGKVVQIDAGNLLSLDVKLTPGKAGTGFVRLTERAGKAISDPELRGEVLRLGQSLGLDWVWLCQLKHGAYEIRMPCYLFEFSHAKVVHKDQLIMDVNEYGLEEEVRNFGRKFMREGMSDLRKFREEGDPLSSHSGTEDWYRDDSESARDTRDTHAEEEDKTPQRQKESGDPLDEKDGTEDW